MREHIYIKHFMHSAKDLCIRAKSMANQLQFSTHTDTIILMILLA